MAVLWKGISFDCWTSFVQDDGSLILKETITLQAGDDNKTPQITDTHLQISPQFTDTHPKSRCTHVQ